ncbi:hypothetical protein D7030_10980 [Flavobacteriaceae bacterium AU392]|nr:hypothetical protein D1817_13690 [Flavobacteriaceae bacterium]RKM82683.1 hypothetical protein D7030_10980 [Flavobacteriaceae bacterium AU392]
MLLITTVLEEYTFGSKIILGVFFTVIGLMFIYYTIKLIEMAYVMKYKKPLYNHIYLYKKKLKPYQLQILQQQFSFYKKLSDKEKKYFEHRVVQFIKDKTFIGRDNVIIDDEKKILIAATAVMLTFGFRDFYIGIIDKIFIYPSDFFSNTSQEYHKGEFNPKLEILVLSWDHFIEGYDVENDKLNLGIHEFAHAIHLNSIKERDVSSTIFEDSFKELTELLANNDGLRRELIDSTFFRAYAYTNQFEFVAVVIESFIESSSELRSQFPEIYAKIKQMLNFNFAGY